MSIAKNIERALIRHDMSVARLADISGVTKTSINKYLSGAIIPADEIVLALENALGERLRPEKRQSRSGKIKVEEAAEMMGKSPQWIRVMLQTGRLPESFGIATRGESGRWNYYISPKGFEDYTGIEVIR